MDNSKPVAVVVEDEADVRDVAVALFEESEMRVMPCDSAEKAFATLCRHGDETAVLFADVRPRRADGRHRSRAPRQAHVAARAHHPDVGLSGQ
jgi:FixJ family two-component response regulator